MQVIRTNIPGFEQRSGICWDIRVYGDDNYQKLKKLCAVSNKRVTATTYALAVATGPWLHQQGSEELVEAVH